VNACDCLRRGNNRDADGTVDRSPPPTPEVKKILKEVKRGILRSVPRLRALYRALDIVVTPSRDTDLVA
jgi:hypothetical protein